MKIGIIGAGKVGSTLGRRWAGCGHEVTYGVHHPDDPQHQPLKDHARVTSSQRAAQEAEVVAL